MTATITFPEVRAVRLDDRPAARRRPGRPVRRGHYGAWRAAAAVPAMFGSLCLMLVLFGWLGRWEPAAMLAWLAAGAAVFTRVGEWCTVRAAVGFRRPNRDQAATLAPAWRHALASAGYTGGELDLYVQRSGHVNAYATGGRSVAVTTAAMREFLARRLTGDQMSAVLVHELGHHRTGGTRFSLVSLWLAAPWRFASRLVVGVCYALVARRQPGMLLGLVVIAVVVTAIVQAVDQQQWAVAVVLAGVAGCAVVCPLADAVAARRSEYAADRFAAEHGCGPQLVSALLTLGGGTDGPRGVRRLLSWHPSIPRRVQALSRYGTPAGGAPRAPPPPRGAGGGRGRPAPPRGARRGG